MDLDVKQGSTSNGEHFGDLELMKVLEACNNVNVMVFCAQHYGGLLLGWQRSKYIREMVEEALEAANPMTFVPPKNQHTSVPLRWWMTTWRRGLQRLRSFTFIGRECRSLIFLTALVHEWAGLTCSYEYGLKSNYNICSTYCL